MSTNNNGIRRLPTRPYEPRTGNKPAPPSNPILGKFEEEIDELRRLLHAERKRNAIVQQTLCNQIEQTKRHNTELLDLLLNTTEACSAVPRLKVKAGRQ